MNNWTGATLLITGGTGSFGSTVLKHFLASDIGEIRIFSRDEKKQDWMRHSLQANYPEQASKVKFYIGDVRNPDSVQARAQVAYERAGTVLCCTRYGNVMCSRGSVIPLFIDQIKRKAPITITDPNMTRFLMNLDEAVDLVAFAFEHAEPGDLFIQKADASTIGDLAKGVMKLFGETECKIIGSRHGEKLYETLMTREERLRSTDMGRYFRIAPDSRGLNYDKFYVEGTVRTEGEDAYTSHNTNRLDVDGVVEKIKTTDYVKEELEGRPHLVEA